MTLIENLDEVLTNSKNLIPSLNNPFDLDTDKPINVGIDKVRIGFNLVPPFLRDEDALQRSKGGRKATWPITEDVALSLFTNTKKGVHRGYITFNPARIVDPHGITCASWEETLVAIGKCAEIAYDQFFYFMPGLADLDVYSLHLAADFGPISDMQRVLNRALRLQVFRGSKPHCYYSADGEDIESVYFKSSTRGQVKFYDKSVQANLPVPILRIEYETERPLHRADGSHKVRYVNSAVIERLFRSRLEPIIKALNPTKRLRVDEILRDPAETKTLIQICGREFLKHHGVFPPMSSAHRTDKKKFEAKYQHSMIEDIL
jgi:hypothetical protein